MLLYKKMAFNRSANQSINQPIEGANLTVLGEGA